MLLDVETKLLFKNWSPIDFCKKQWITENHTCFLQNFEKKGDLNVIDINRTTHFRSMGILACFSCFDQANRERLR